MTHHRSMPCAFQLLGLVLLSFMWGVDCFHSGLVPIARTRTLCHRHSSTACTSRDLPVSVLSVSSRGINGSTLNGAVDHVALNAPASFFTKLGMVSFVASMCLALPATLLPQLLLFRLGIISRTRKERWALATSQFCARFVHRLFPFCKISVKTDVAHEANPLPAVWACNHTSMLDVFILLISDRKLRGPNKRPIKIVYWKNLEDNPVTALLFRQAGFIPVAMTANEPGEANQYDKGSFKQLLKSCKKAFDEGFDIGILPEGQLNPEPEKGLLPIFTGAFTLARLSKRPIRLMALNGLHRMWHPVKGMHVTGRQAKIRAYGQERSYGSADEFKATFERVVGEFGSKGDDLEAKELDSWLSGEAWKRKKAA